MKKDQETLDFSGEEKIGFWQCIKKIWQEIKDVFSKDVFGSASFGWGFALGFYVHKVLLDVGKPGLLWRLF